MTKQAWSPPPPLSREQTASMNRQRLAVSERAEVTEEAERTATAVRENMARLRELRLAKEAEREISAGRFPAEGKPKTDRMIRPSALREDADRAKVRGSFRAACPIGEVPPSISAPACTRKRTRDQSPAPNVVTARDAGRRGTGGLVSAKHIGKTQEP